MVLDMHPDLKVSFILRRPFLSTANAHIDVKIGEIKFTTNRQEECFTFKPRPELNSTANMIQERKSESPTLGLDDTLEE
jgi:hypothetical protein